MIRPSPTSETLASRDTSLIVSLTSHGTRTRWVHLAIESIVASGCIPSNVYLWISPEAKAGKHLERLSHRGLNIMRVVDRRSHTKYCYLDMVYPREEQFGFLIADDDMIYSRNWYRTMITASKTNPNVPIVFYGTQAYVNQNGVSFTPTDDKLSSLASKADLLFHPFSGSGLYVPKAVVPRINKDPDSFLPVCPTSDDIWLHREFFRLGLPVHTIGDKTMPPSIPFINTKSALFQINWNGGQNEVQIENAFRGLV